MCVNAVANSVILQNNCYHIFFKFNHTLYIVLGSAPPNEKFWVSTCCCLWGTIWGWRKGWSSGIRHWELGL